MNDKRKATRRAVDMAILKHDDGKSYLCRALQISPSGIRVERCPLPTAKDRVVDIEMPIAGDKATLSVRCRQIWNDGDCEAFEFLDQTFYQQAVLERFFNNY